MINMVDFEVYLQGGSPWGFRLQGGREFRMPIRIAKVEPGGKAYNGGIEVGDHVTEIEGINTENMYHTEALTGVKRAQYSLSLLLARPDKNGESGNAIHSVGLTPEATNTRVSLVIGPRRSISSDKINSRSTDDISNEDLDIPQGQTYMKKLMRNRTMDDEPVERPRSKTPPNNERGYTHPEFSSKSLPRRKEGGYTHPEYSSKSLPRNRAKSTTDAPSNKAPSWYKDMYKEMHTSMEKESHLSKLLASDAKRGAFRKYDGITSPLTDRNDCYNMQQSATYEDAPRRLQGGRSIANHPNRKSLPNIHAASFNFMTDYTNTKPNTYNKPESASSKSSSSSVNSDWYRHIQKGGKIPETGLAVKTTDSSNTPEINQSRGPHSPKWETLIPAPDDDDLSDLLPYESDISKPISISIEYNNPPDFLELRKQEIKNREVENEREAIREQREKERLTEEGKLIEQKTKDFLKIEEEKRRLKLKEEELKIKEELLLQQEEEQEERRIHKIKEANFMRREQDERQLKQKQEEISRKEKEEKRLLRLKEEELKRKEELLWKQEQEFEERRLAKQKEAENRKRKELEEVRIHKLREEEQRKEIEEKRLLKLKAEELDRKEKEEIRRLRLKEEELKRKEELLLKMEAEQMEKQRLLEEPLKPQLPPFGKAKYSFHPQGPGELEFKKGEIITIIGAVDENWIEGEYNGNIGIFPVSYIELINSLPGEHIPGNIKKTITHPEPTDHGEEMDSKYFRPNGELSVEIPSDDPEVFSTASIPLVNGTEHDFPGVTENAITMEEEENLETCPEGILSGDVDKLPSPQIEEGLACARYTFKAETDSELSFKKGDAIVILKRVDDNWYEGELNGKIGILPVNYVKVSKEPVMVEKAPIMLEEPTGLRDFVKDPMPANVLKSKKVQERKPSAEMIIDDVLNAHAVDKKAKDDPMMTNGYGHTNGPAGKTLIDDLIGQGDPYKAVYKYYATNEDEIELMVGDVVHVLEKCDDNWYVGTSQRTGAFGTFPGNYVSPL